MADKSYTKQIYNIGAVLGMVDPHSRADDLHFLVYRITGKLSVRELTDDEARKVIGELRDYMKLSKLEENQPSAPPRSVVSERQKNFAFRLLYRLISLDEKQSKSTARERMIGVIEKVTNKKVKADQDIFATLSEAEGSSVIEELKRYISTAAKRDLRRKNERSELCKN